jgi:hypothetical protein
MLIKRAALSAYVKKRQNAALTSVCGIFVSYRKGIDFCFIVAYYISTQVMPTLT